MSASHEHSPSSPQSPGPTRSTLKCVPPGVPAPPLKQVQLPQLNGTAPLRCEWPQRAGLIATSPIFGELVDVARKIAPECQDQVQFDHAFSSILVVARQQRSGELLFILNSICQADTPQLPALQELARGLHRAMPSLHSRYLRAVVRGLKIGRTIVETGAEYRTIWTASSPARRDAADRVFAQVLHSGWPLAATAGIILRLHAGNAPSEPNAPEPADAQRTRPSGIPLYQLEAIVQGTLNALPFDRTKASPPRPPLTLRLLLGSLHAPAAALFKDALKHHWNISAIARALARLEASPEFHPVIRQLSAYYRAQGWDPARVLQRLAPPATPQGVAALISTASQHGLSLDCIPLSKNTPSLRHWRYFDQLHQLLQRNVDLSVHYNEAPINDLPRIEHLRELGPGTKELWQILEDIERLPVQRRAAQALLTIMSRQRGIEIGAALNELYCDGVDCIPFSRFWSLDRSSVDAVRQREIPESYQAFFRMLDLHLNFGSLTFDCRRTAPEQPAMIARFAADVGAQVRCLNCRDNTEFPGPGFVISGLSNERIFALDEAAKARGEDPLLRYRDAWPWLSESFERLGRTTFIFTRGFIAVLPPEERQSSVVPSALMVINEHHRTRSGQLAYLVPAEWLKTQVLPCAIEALDYVNFLNFLPDINGAGLHPDLFRFRLHPHVLDLGRASNLVLGFSNAFAPNSQPYFQWEQGFSDHLRDPWGHVKHEDLELRGDVHYRAQSLVNAHQQVVSATSTAQNLFDLFRIALAYWHRGYTASEQPLGEYRMLHEAYAWHQRSTRGLEHESPILIAAPMLSYHYMPSPFVLNTTDMVLTIGERKIQLPQARSFYAAGSDGAVKEAEALWRTHVLARITHHHDLRLISPISYSPAEDSV